MNRLLPLVRILLASISGMMLCCSVKGAEINDAEFGFSVTIPDGFVPVPGFVRHGDELYMFAHGTAGTPDGRLITIMRLRSQLSRSPTGLTDLQREQMQSPEATGITIKWKKFDLSGVRSERTQASGQVSVLAVKIPLRGEGIGIGVVGRPGNEDQNLILLQNVVGSVQGASNWDEEASLKAVRELTIAFFGLIIILAIVIGANRKTRKKPEGRPPALPG